MAKAKARVTLYVVREGTWEFNEEFYVRLDDAYFEEVEMAGLEADRPPPLQAFLTREKAEANRVERERAMRAELNPFDYGGAGFFLRDFSSLPPQAFTDRLKQVGVKPPVLNGRGNTTRSEPLTSWFMQQHLTPEQAHVIWDALDRVRLLEVVPMEVELEG